MGHRRNEPEGDTKAEQARTDYVIVWLAIGMAALFVVFMLADRHHAFRTVAEQPHIEQPAPII
jgi:hypothetical protein